MSRLSSRERRRIAEIAERLERLRIGEDDAIAEMMPAVRELLDADNAIFYSLVEQDEGWRVGRWHGDGEVGQVRELLSAAVASSDRVIVFYNPRAPEAWMRNRVIEVTERIERREGPGRWLDWSVCKDVFRPAHMERHKHLRALLCDGEELLGWLGSLVPAMPERHHFDLLSALVPVFRRRLILERRLDHTPRTFAALEAALERTGAPAFVIDALGPIRATNASGRVLLAERATEVAEAIRAAKLGRHHALDLELTPLAANGVRDGWLAIARIDSRDARIARALTRARSSWTLTDRQYAVLERILRGESTATIAANLDISSRAVEAHVTALLQRADVDNRAALVATVLLE